MAGFEELSDQTAQQQLRQDDRGKELHDLKLGPRERAGQQTEPHAEQRHRRAQDDHQPGAGGDVKPEQPQRHGAGERGLHHRGRPEGEAVPTEQLELSQRRAQQPLQRAGCPLAQDRHRRDQEHREQREQRQHRGADRIERGQVLCVDQPQQTHQRDRDGQQQGHGAGIAA